MPRSLRIFGGFVLALMALLGLVMALSPSSEVVNLTTLDDSGAPTTTPLWVVDHEGTQWLRGGTNSSWMLQLRANPEVELERQGKTTAYRAVPDPAKLEAIDHAMAEKYGASNGMVDLFADKSATTAVRLVPR